MTRKSAFPKTEFPENKFQIGSFKNKFKWVTFNCRRHFTDEDKSLRHVAMVAKFSGWQQTEKRDQKSEFALFDFIDLIQFRSRFSFN